MLIVHLCQSFKANIPSIFLHNLRLSPVRFQNFHKIDLKLGMDICLTYSSTFHRSFEGSDNIPIHTYIQVFVFIKISKFVRTIRFFSKTKVNGRKTWVGYYAISQFSLSSLVSLSWVGGCMAYFPLLAIVDFKRFHQTVIQE